MSKTYIIALVVVLVILVLLYQLYQVYRISAPVDGKIINVTSNDEHHLISVKSTKPDVFSPVSGTVSKLEMNDTYSLISIKHKFGIITLRIFGVNNEPFLVKLNDKVDRSQKLMEADEETVVVFTLPIDYLLEVQKTGDEVSRDNFCSRM